MRPFLFLPILALCPDLTFGQDYERAPVCGNDTVDGYYRHYDRIESKGFSCTQVTKLGIRFDVAFNTFIYNRPTRNWLGNHNGAQLGIALAYGNFSLGARVKLASVSPGTVLLYNGEPLGNNDRVNPAKLEYDISYSWHIKHNLCVEPYLGLNAQYFHVFRDTVEDPLVAKVRGLSIGLTLTKYFRLRKSKNYDYFAVFARYGNGFTDFRKIHNSLGFGYNDISLGISYKAFGKRHFFRSLTGEMPRKKFKAIKE